MIALGLANSRLTADSTLMAALGTPSPPYGVYLGVVPQGKAPPYLVLMPEIEQTQDAKAADGGWEPVIAFGSFTITIWVPGLNTDLLTTLRDRVLDDLLDVAAVVDGRSIQTFGHTVLIPFDVDTSDGQERSRWVARFEWEADP